MDNTSTKTHILDEFHESVERYFTWRDERPFLWVGQCEYCQGLVLEIIRTLKKCIEEGVLYPDEEVLQGLYRLLDEQPPPYRPINSGSVGYDGPFFYQNNHAKINRYGRI